MSTCLFCALKCRRIFDAPMRGDRLSGPERTNLRRRGIAHGHDHIERWCVRSGKFLPTFTAQAVHRQTHALEGFESQRMDGALRVTARRRGRTSCAAEVIQEHFSHNAPGRVTRAEKQDMHDALTHGAPPGISGLPQAMSCPWHASAVVS